jgi:hypothetical protein
MIGRAVLELENGRTVEGDFIGHAVIEGIRTEDPKLSVFRAWGVRPRRYPRVLTFTTKIIC